MRPSWDEYFMQLAYSAASRATCPRRSVGAVIVKDKTVVATGYNGAPSNHLHCTAVGCDLDDVGSCQRTIHAEANAISRRLTCLCDGTIYVSDRPCLICSRAIAYSGITRVVYSRPYWRNEHDVLSLFMEEGILVQQLL